MRNFCSIVSLALLTSFSALAQTQDPQQRLALTAEASGAAGSAAPVRLTCAPIAGQIVDAEGQPISSATLLIKGTQHAFVTDTEGRFQLNVPVYQKQVLAVEAAGYNSLLVPINDCKLPVLMLERDPSVKIKRSGKRAGQVIRYGDAYRQ